LFILSLVAAFANLKPGGRVAAGAVLLFAGLLTVAVVAVIARGVIDQGEVNRDSVRGAIAIYVLLGLLFLFVYDALAALASAPMFAQATDGSPSVRAYFSFVTLATLGYGDYTPAGTLGRTAAVIEALSGQLYLVTVVALLVSRLRER
jgi:ion channel